MKLKRFLYQKQIIISIIAFIITLGIKDISDRLNYFIQLFYQLYYEVE